MKDNSNVKINVDGTTGVVGVLLFLPFILLFGAVLSVWGAWWIQDIWELYLTGLIGPAPSVITLAIFGIAFRAMFPLPSNKEDNSYNGLLNSIIGAPFAWLFANLVAWVF